MAIAKSTNRHRAMSSSRKACRRARAAETQARGDRAVHLVGMQSRICPVAGPSIGNACRGRTHVGTTSGPGNATMHRHATHRHTTHRHTTHRHTTHGHTTHGHTTHGHTTHGHTTPQTRRPRDATTSRRHIVPGKAMNLFPLLMGARSRRGGGGGLSPAASTAARTVTAAMRHLASTRGLAHAGAVLCRERAGRGRNRQHRRRSRAVRTHASARVGLPPKHARYAHGRTAPRGSNRDGVPLSTSLTTSVRADDGIAPSEISARPMCAANTAQQCGE
jgi:hypothetical protein